MIYNYENDYGNGKVLLQIILRLHTHMYVGVEKEEKKAFYHLNSFYLKT